MNASASFSRKLAIVLIICAVFGTEISYHFTLESRFEAIEQKLQQSTVAIQQMQDSLNTLSASKTQTLAGLNRQIESLQTSFAPLGKMSHEQTDALSQVRQEITTLQQAQTEQVDAQKKLSTGIAQLEKARNDARLVAATPPAPALAAQAPASNAESSAVTPAPPSTPVTALPASTPLPTAVPAAAPAPASASPAASTSAAHALFQFPGAFSHAAKVALLPAASNTSDAVDLQASNTSRGDAFRSVRALPVDGAIAR